MERIRMMIDEGWANSTPKVSNTALSPRCGKLPSELPIEPKPACVSQGDGKIAAAALRQIETESNWSRGSNDICLRCTILVELEPYFFFFVFAQFPAESSGTLETRLMKPCGWKRQLMTQRELLEITLLQDWKPRGKNRCSTPNVVEL